ncbi:AAA family ATPase [Stieleria varia]|uniref:Archaeal ATPase n=1 Tax=Stieleria varia TaxID=2528005 RepID=A0A5C6AUS8_9BACT|nr:ATP-binding protein [Stieleria varia]TWU02816.1 Archaeal ATPase [Stieleria varia]
MNPFSYGGIVGNGAFCNRSQELGELTETMQSAGRCFVYAERRMGKTSLILRALGKLPKKQFVSVYVDLWPTDGSAAFAEATAKAISSAAETTTRRLLEVGKSLFGRLRPSVSLDDSGQPKIDFGIEGRAVSKTDLIEVLDAPQKLAKKTGKTVVMVFDEFQQITDYEDDLTERQIRSSIQHHKNVAYIFLGSRKHLLQSMFLDESRPLYRSAMHYPIGPIDTKHWQPFILKRFQDAKKRIDRSVIDELCARTGGHPFYTQHLCHVLWSMTDAGEEVNGDHLGIAIAELLRRESHAYVNLWESLTKNEQRFLRGLAQSEVPPKPFSSDFTRRFGLRTASNSQRAAESLESSDLIEREESSFVITDRFFRLWIRQLFS